MKQTDDYDMASYVWTAEPIKGQVQESDIRLIRQRLSAKRTGHDRRAEVLEAFLVNERGLAIQDVPVEDAPPVWLEAHAVPASAKSAKVVTVLLDSGFVPIFGGSNNEALTADMAQQVLDHGAELPSSGSQAWRKELRGLVDGAPRPTWRDVGRPLTGVPAPAPDWEAKK